MKKKYIKEFIQFLLMITRIIFFVLFIAPLIWLIVSSFKNEQSIFMDMQSLLAFIPKEISFENYRIAFIRADLFKYIVNSLRYVFLITFFGLIFNSVCGYALAKLDVPFAKYILGFIISLIIIPFESIILPLFLLVNKLGWVNQLPALVIPFIANCFSIFLFRQFFLGVPNDYLESARIDGASDLRAFIAIVIPQSFTVYATVFILTFVLHWGDFMWPLIVASTDSLRTIQVGIQFLFTNPPMSYGVILAGLTISTIPLAIVFLFFQKYYVQSVSASGLKG